MFLIEIQLKKENIKKNFWCTKVWALKPVYQSPKRQEYVTANVFVSVEHKIAIFQRGHILTEIIENQI